MYGYVFAAAEVGVTHRIRRDVMLYPGYEPYLGRPPMIMHYGAAYTLGKAYFNKMEHQKLTLETCPQFLFADAAIGSVEQLTHPHLNPHPNPNPTLTPTPTQATSSSSPRRMPCPSSTSPP